MNSVKFEMTFNLIQFSFLQIDRTYNAYIFLYILIIDTNQALTYMNNSAYEILIMYTQQIVFFLYLYLTKGAQYIRWRISHDRAVYLHNIGIVHCIQKNINLLLKVIIQFIFFLLSFIFNKEYFLDNNLKYTYYTILEELIIMYLKEEFIFF